MPVKRTLLFFTILVLVDCSREPETFTIGGLFDYEREDEAIAFEQAVDNANEENILKHSRRLEAQPITVATENDFLVSGTVCKLFENGVSGILGPTSGSSADYVQSMCDTKEIPHLETNWDVQYRRDSCMINLFPYPPTMARAYKDMVLAWKWKDFTILYENPRGLAVLSEVIKLNDHHVDVTIMVRGLDTALDSNYRPVFREAKKAGETHFLLESSIENLGEILKQAQQVGLMSDQHHYIILNPDMHTIDMEPYQHGGTNITGIRFVNPESPKVIGIAEKFAERLTNSFPNRETDAAPENHLRLNTALIYDAVELFSRSLRQLTSSKRLHQIPLYCNSTDNWAHGYSLINYMKMNTIPGLSGQIIFDHQGFRSDFQFDIIELGYEGLKKVGTWNSMQKEPFNFSRPVRTHYFMDDDSLANKSFIVITALTDPYGMRKKTSLNVEGNDQYEGYGIDLIHELSLMLGFNYSFRLQEDSVYGGLNKKTKQWTGMIKELMEYRADLAITDFTITAERESGVDFTMPFMSLGISILYKKPTKVPPKLFSFTDPFSTKVWIYLAVAYFFVAVMLYVLGRISPAEWNNPYPCVDEPEFLINQFSLRNCFWFAVGSLLQQGSEIAPIAISTRMVAGLWWFFTLIMVSSYTANLAAFLTIETVYSPIKNIEDLANQNVIKYGAKKGGATANFFRDSNHSLYQKIWKYMDENEDDVMTATNPIGLERTEREDYAFLMESTSIEYAIERQCNLTQVGGLLDDKGYGIAMRKNSSYRNTLSAAVVKLQETGKLALLKNKWWKEQRGGGACTDDAKSEGAEELNLENVGGVFLVLVAGSIGGIFVAISEMLLGVCKRAYNNKVTFKEELITEIKFVASFKGQTKPITQRKSESPDESQNKSAESFSAQPYGFIPELRKLSSNQEC